MGSRQVNKPDESHLQDRDLNHRIDLRRVLVLSTEVLPGPTRTSVNGKVVE